MATRIFNLSISAGVADATPTLAFFVIIEYNRSLSNSDNFLESFNPSMLLSIGKMTDAHTTGPAQGPRPASSMPATL